MKVLQGAVSEQTRAANGQVVEQLLAYERKMSPWGCNRKRNLLKRLVAGGDHRPLGYENDRIQLTD